MPTSTPRPVPTFTPTLVPSPTFTPTLVSSPTFTPTPVPSPTPTLTVSGTYDNRMEHADGRYALQLSGTRVAATFSTARSPVQYWAREVPYPLFTAPEPFRPPYPVLRTAVGTPVRADGVSDPDHPEPRRFLLRVDPDGTVHYVDDTHVEGVGYLAYSLETVWGTTPAANDRAVLEILDEHWFRKTVLSAEPPPVQFEIPEQTIVDAWGDEKLVLAHLAGAFVTLDGTGRVTELGAPRYALNGILLPELGQLHRLERLDLGYIHPLSVKWRNGRYASHAKRRIECDLRLVRCIGTPSFLQRADMTEQDSRQALEWVLEWLGREDVPGHLVWPEVDHLTGAIPAQLGQLNSLRHLDLAGHLLTGPLPPAIGHLVNLEHLDLRDNWLTGSLPPAIGHLASLEYLNLSYNWLSVPLSPAIGRLADLKYLDLRDNSLTGPLPSEWGQLTNLRHLHLYNNRLTGPMPPEWGQLTNLQDLSLHSNGLTGPLPPEWGQLTNLRHLHLDYNRLSGLLPAEWGQLASLQQLDLSRHTYPPPGPPGNDLTGPLPPEWGQLTNLHHLGLSRNRLTGPIPPEWSQIASLQVLGLDGNQLTGCYSKVSPKLTVDTDLPRCPD